MIQNFITKPTELFIQNEIEINRKGKLTIAQIANLEKTIFQVKRLLKAFIVLWYLVYFTIIAIMNMDNLSIKLKQVDFWMYKVIPPALIPLLIYRLIPKKNAAIINETCLIASGQAIKRSYSGRKTSSIIYNIEINKVIFFCQ